MIWARVGLPLCVTVLVSGRVLAQAPDAGAETGHSQIIEEEDEAPDILSLSLDDLLAQPVEVASRRAEKLREAPSVISVITREELQAMGARDLSDALSFVPGFTQALDVQNTVGLGVRGIWSHEGKVLLLFDGIDMTDLLYGTNSLGMHYLVSNIERIEIIRGPGSAVYGGNAGMAVINIITRSAESLEGGELHARYGSMYGAFSDRTLGLNLGHTFELNEHPVAVSLTGYLGQGNRSNGTYRSFDGESAELGHDNNSSTDPRMLIASIAWRGLSAKFLYDGFSVGTVDGLGSLARSTAEDGTTVVKASRMRFETIGADLRYTFSPSSTVTLEPRVFFKRQRPWVETDAASSNFYDKSVQRLGAGLAAAYQVVPALQLTAGLEGTWDFGVVNQAALVGTGLQTDFAALNPKNPKRADIVNGVIYAQARWETSIAAFTIGGRGELNSAVGPSFVPRIAITKNIDRFTAKLLFSGAFRAPSLENLNLGENLKPERIWAGEAELGYQVTDWAYASVNFYSIDVLQMIAYSVDTTTGIEAYRNAGQVGSRGVEAEVHIRGSHGFARLSFSQGEPSATTDVSGFILPNTRSRLMAMPVRKFTAMGRLYLGRGVSANPSIVVMSERLGYLGVGEDGQPALGAVPVTGVLNFNFTWESPSNGTWLSGLSVTAGANNILNAPQPFIQAYDGGHAPLPGRGTDLFVRLSYALDVARPAPGAVLAPSER